MAPRHRSEARFRAPKAAVRPLDGRLAGVFFPPPESTLPIEFKRELFSVLSAELSRQVKKRKLVEGEVLADFESWQKGPRETGRLR